MLMLLMCCPFFYTFRCLSARWCACVREWTSVCRYSFQCSICIGHITLWFYYHNSIIAGRACVQFQVDFCSNWFFYSISSWMCDEVDEHKCGVIEHTHNWKTHNTLKWYEKQMLDRLFNFSLYSSICERTIKSSNKKKKIETTMGESANTLAT